MTVSRGQVSFHNASFTSSLYKYLSYNLTVIIRWWMWGERINIGYIPRNESSEWSLEQMSLEGKWVVDKICPYSLYFTLVCRFYVWVYLTKKKKINKTLFINISKIQNMWVFWTAIILAVAPSTMCQTANFDRNQEKKWKLHYSLVELPCHSTFPFSFKVCFGGFSIKLLERCLIYLDKTYIVSYILG